IYMQSNVAVDYPATNLVMATLREAIGDLAGARRTIGRIAVTLPVSPQYEATYLREQARLPLLAADTAPAIQARPRFVGRPRHPESALLPEVERERTLLAGLVGR